jgi:hypothetical protein
MKTSSFLLENDFQWGENIAAAEQRRLWRDMIYDENPNPTLPLVVNQNGNYMTTREEIRTAYYTSNHQWDVTLRVVHERLNSVRTDIAQYVKNLQNLEKNNEVLTKRIHELSGVLFPPFPDTSLYTTLFPHDMESAPGFPVVPNLTWRMLLSSLDANTLYYHQELGKYNALKKEECRLCCICQQITTRMKLWIFRDRMKLIQMEINQLFDSKFDFVKKELLDIKTTKQGTYALGQRRRSYQCIDFCQCECCITEAREKKKVTPS